MIDQATIPPELQAELDLLLHENRGQYDYVLARAHAASITDALAAADLTPSWYYHKTEEQRNRMEDVAGRLHQFTRWQAWLAIENAALEAARVKVKGLADKNVWVRQQAATEILNRAGIQAPTSDSSTLHIPELDEVIKRVWPTPTEQD